MSEFIITKVVAEKFTYYLSQVYDYRNETFFKWNGLRDNADLFSKDTANRMLWKLNDKYPNDKTFDICRK